MKATSHFMDGILATRSRMPLRLNARAASVLQRQRHWPRGAATIFHHDGTDHDGRNGWQNCCSENINTAHRNDRREKSGSVNQNAQFGIAWRRKIIPPTGERAKHESSQKYREHSAHDISLADKARGDGEV